MKNLFRTSTIVLAFVAILAVSSAMAKVNSGTIKLNSTTRFAGTELKAGEYKVEWNENGAVTVKQGKNVVATGQATVEPQANAAVHTFVVTSVEADGRERVKRIQLVNSKQLLVLGDDAQQKASGN